MFSTRKVPAALAAAAVAAILAGCSSSAGSSAPKTAASSGGTTATTTTVVVGVTSATAPPTMLPVVAQQLGIAAKYHIKIQLKNISPDVTAQALSTGSIDVLAAPSVEQSILQGAKFKVIAGAAKPYIALWGKKGDVTSWASLKGKRVGIPAGEDSSDTALFNVLLQEHGLSPTDVTLEYNTATSNYDAMAAGAIDAGLTTPPYTYKLQSGGKFAQVDSLTESEEGYLSTEYTASDQYINANPAAIAGFVEMLQATVGQLTQTPVSPAVLAAIDKNLQANGITPGQFDVTRFLAQLADDKTWQIVPTKQLISGDLSLLEKIPSLTSAAKAATFGDIVYTVPGLASEYNG